MPNYTGKCPGCGYEEVFFCNHFIEIGHPIEHACPCCLSPMIRRISFHWKRPMAPYYNITLDRWVDNRRQWEDGLKEKTDEMSERTGMEHRYVEADYADATYLGVTSEGLAEQKAAHYGTPLYDKLKDEV